MLTILAGFKACGKTVVGKQLAQLMGVEFADLAGEVEHRYLAKFGEALAVGRIYQEIGVTGIRAMEREAIVELQQRSPLVLEISSGVLMHEENRRILKNGGKLVYLALAAEVLFARIQAQGPPDTLDLDDPRRSFETLYTQRRSLFEAVCDVAIDATDLTVEDAALAIFQALQCHESM